MPPAEQPLRFMEFVERQYPLVAMLAGQSAMCSSPDSGRQGGGSAQDSRSEKKQTKATVNAAQAAAPATPAQPQRQQQQSPRQQPQAQRQGWGNGPRPCRMADKGCKEIHRMDKCGVFGRMTAEQKLAVLQEKRLCLF